MAPAGNRFSMFRLFDMLKGIADFPLRSTSSGQADLAQHRGPIRARRSLKTARSTTDRPVGEYCKGHGLFGVRRQAVII